MLQLIVVPLKVASALSLIMVWALTLEYRFSTYRESGKWLLRRMVTQRGLVMGLAVILMLMFF